MIRAIIICVVLLSSPAFASNAPDPTVSDGVVAGSPCQDAFKDVPAIADRLNVKPIKSGDGGSLVLMLCDGRQYDFFEILNAALDRLDTAIRFQQMQWMPLLSAPPRWITFSTPTVTWGAPPAPAQPDTWLYRSPVTMEPGSK